MKANMTEPENKQDNDVRDIPKWVRRYADSRAVLPSLLVGLLVPLSLTVLLFIIFVPIILLHRFLWLAGYPTAGIIALACGSAVWFSAMWWLVRHPARVREIALAVRCKMGNWIYRGEGDATAPPEETPKWLAYTYLVIILGPVLILPACECLPPQYWQPLTALLWLPLLSYSIVRDMLRGEPVSSGLMLLWPGLYAVHAVLIMAGLPIYVTGPLGMVANCGLLVGYGLIAALAAHIYSRVALRRLRALATTPETVDQSIEGGGS